MLRSAVFTVQTVVSIPYKLQVVAHLCLSGFLLHICFLDDDEGVWIDVVQVVTCSFSRNLCLEELIVLPDLSLSVIYSADPVACSLDLSSIWSLSSTAFWVVGAVDSCNISMDTALM